MDGAIRRGGLPQRGAAGGEKRGLVELRDLHRRPVDNADDLLELGGTAGLLVHFQVEDRFEVFQRALHLRIPAQLAADHPRLQTLPDMGQVLLVLGVQLFSFLADNDFFTSVVIFHADKAPVLEQIQRRVDHPGLGL